MVNIERVRRLLVFVTQREPLSEALSDAVHVQVTRKPQQEGQCLSKAIKPWMFFQDESLHAGRRRGIYLSDDGDVHPQESV